MPIIEAKCPNCGATLNVDDSRDFFFCEFCGTKIVNAHQKIDITQNINVTHKIDRAGLPNLCITYSSTNSDVSMILKFADTGEAMTVMNGQQLSFHLSPGLHKIIMKVGKINYNREIVINEDNALVSIYVNFTGRTGIVVDQPPYDAVKLGMDPNYKLRAWENKSGVGKLVWGSILATAGVIGLFAWEKASSAAILLLVLGGGLIFWGIMRTVRQ